MNLSVAGLNEFFGSPIGQVVTGLVTPKPKESKPAPAPVAPANVPEQGMGKGMLIGLIAAGVAAVGLVIFALRE